MLPFEFVIEGPPMSAQSHNPQRLAAWKARVRLAASLSWVGEPCSGKVRVVVTYYHDGDTARLDTDNMLKPILDALGGLVYVDDRQASHVQARSVDKRRGFVERSLRRLVAEGLETGREFIHIRIDEEQ